MNEPTLSGRYPLKQAVINKATATSSAIVAAVAGKSIRVISLVMVSAASVVATWEDGDGTDRTGPMTVNGVLTANSENGLFWTAPGEALNLLLGTAVQVSGVLTYVETGAWPA